jgi:IS30 family transposase
VGSEETGFGTTKCPGCGEAIPISETIHHQIAERTRREFKAEALEGKRILAAKEHELNEKAAALNKTISDRLAAERANLSKEIEARLRSGLSTEIADLKRQADERSERLAQAQTIELELRTEKRNLEEREKARDLEMARKLDEERGHWEGDLLSGPNNTYIATLVERQTRYVMLAKVAGKDTRTVVTALIKQAKKLPKELYKSLTWDRGKELTAHRRFTLATNIDVYFCDPQSPWQRGSNENTNGLLRQYFPQGTDLSVHSQAHLNKVARQLNERPRQTLQFETPAERFNACVASTG